MKEALTEALQLLIKNYTQRLKDGNSLFAGEQKVLMELCHAYGITRDDGGDSLVGFIKDNSFEGLKDFQ